MDQLTDLIPDYYFVELQSLVDEKTILSGSQELSSLGNSFYPYVSKNHLNNNVYNLTIY